MINGKIWLSTPTMHAEEMEYIKEAFDTNWVAPLGPNVSGFESDMASYLGEGMHAAALSSGTAAIHLAMRILGVSRQERVFASSLTFAATVNPVTYEGAVPVFIDSETDSWNMDPDCLEAAFEKYPDTRVVIAADLYGTPAKLVELEQICERHGAVLIEDSAESLGSVCRGRMAGNFGAMGILSFNGNKIITTSGGGMLVSSDPEIVEKARFLSTQAREKELWYEHREIGFNYRMSNVVAGIGRGQMKHIQEHIQLKKKIREQYRKGFSDIPGVRLNPIPEECDANCWLTCMTIDPGMGKDPIDLVKRLSEKNIETRPIWKPMNLQPVFRENDFITLRESGSVGQDIFETGLCLPSDIKNTEEDMELVIGEIRRFLGK